MQLSVMYAKPEIVGLVSAFWPYLGTGADARWASMVLSAIDLLSFSCLFFSI